MLTSFRTAAPSELAQALQDARDYTLTLFDCMAAAGLDHAEKVERLPHVNPPLWELGHIAWYAERYVLRAGLHATDSDSNGSAGTAPRGSMLSRGDDWFDQDMVPHETRWALELPSTGAVKMYCNEMLDRVLDKLSRSADDERSLYPYRMVLAHEDLHGEAM